MPDEALPCPTELNRELAVCVSREQAATALSRVWTDTSAAMRRSNCDKEISYQAEFSGRYEFLIRVILEKAYAWALTETLTQTCFFPKESASLSVALFTLKPLGAGTGVSAKPSVLYLLYDGEGRPFFKKAMSFFFEGLRAILPQEWQQSGSGQVISQFFILPLSEFEQTKLVLCSSSFEARAALIKFETVAGDSAFCERVQTARQAAVYTEEPFEFSAAIRERIRHQGSFGRERPHAKDSPGGLLDIEYLVATLQLAYGRCLRGDVHSQDTRKALYGLWRAGVVGEKAYQDLRAAYVFLSGLIRALSEAGLPLELPADQHPCTTDIARRLGYRGDGLQILLEFKMACQHHMAAAERFYERILINLANQPWREIPGNVVVSEEATRVSLDDLLRGEPRPEDQAVLRRLGFLDIRQTAMRFKELCPNMTAFEPFSHAIENAWRFWPRVPSPDLALEFLAAFMRLNENSYRGWYALAKSEKGFRLLLTLFGSSRYLSSLFLKHREVWPWLEQTQFLSTTQCLEALRLAGQTLQDKHSLGAIKERETLRLALTDSLMGESFAEIMRIHDKQVLWLLNELMRCDGLNQACLLGSGGLGAGELALGPAADWILVSSEAESARAQTFAQRLLAGPTGESFFQAADFSLSGPRGPEVLNEVQARARLTERMNEGGIFESFQWTPAVGNQKLGNALLREAGCFSVSGATIAETLQVFRSEKEKQAASTASRLESDRDLRLGLGGLREIELVCGFGQKTWANTHPEVSATSSVLVTLERMRDQGQLTETDFFHLHEAFIYQKKTLSRLRLWSFSGVSVLPAEREQLHITAKLLGFNDQGIETAEDQFMRHLGNLRAVAHAVYKKFFNEALYSEYKIL